MTPHEESFGPNVAKILCGATRVVKGSIPLAVRKELMAAVKAGVLGRLVRDGQKPEVFFHLDHRNGAIERQKKEAEYSQNCISGVIASPAQVREGIEAMGGDVVDYLLSGRAST